MKEKNPKRNPKYRLHINMSVFYDAMDFDINNCSILLIYEPKEFFEDISTGIKKAVEESEKITILSNLSEPPYLASMVKYDLNLNDGFFDISSYDALFHKQPEYKNQSEARIIIPHTCFHRDPVYCSDSYRDNQLEVPLQRIKEYGTVLPAKDVNAIDFFEFNESFDRYEIGVL